MFMRTLCTSLLIAGLLAIPVSAGEKYLYGSPELNAIVAGTNEFLTGEEVSLTIIITNKGLMGVKVVQPTIISRDDVPSTAKLVGVLLTSGDAPVQVKSGIQLIGDIPGGMGMPATFTVKFDEDAVPGLYELPVMIEYTYLSAVEETGDTLQYFYSTKQETHTIILFLKSEATPGVLGIETRSLNVGTEGYVTLTLQNTGYANARDAVIRIARNGNSPLVPTDSSVYVGDFPPGSTVTTTFKVAVSNDAEVQEYPLDVYVEYHDDDGVQVVSDSVTIGLPVGGKIDFAVISDPPTIQPGEKKVLEVLYKNTGAAPVYRAQARLSAVDPFSSNDDTAYLGDLSPGDTAIARFEVSADAAATIKIYGLDSEIRYRDALDNSQISDSLKIQVEVIPQSGLASTLSNPLVISVIVVTIIGAGYYLLRRRKTE